MNINVGIIDSILIFRVTVLVLVPGLVGIPQKLWWRDALLRNYALTSGAERANFAGQIYRALLVIVNNWKEPWVTRIQIWRRNCFIQIVIYHMVNHAICDLQLSTALRIHLALFAKMSSRLDP